MNKKQMRKLADEIVDLELTYRNPQAPQEVKSRAEKRINQIAGMIAALDAKNGRNFELMGEIDLLVQEKMKKMS